MQPWQPEVKNHHVIATLVGMDSNTQKTNSMRINTTNITPIIHNETAIEEVGSFK